MTSLFVTGGRGFVGRRLLPALARSGPVRALSRTPPPEGPPGVVWVTGDLLAPDGWSGALGSVETVVHLAALTGRARAAELDAVNREGTARLLESCRRNGVRRVLHVSTIAVNFPPWPPYPYARSKAAAEELVRASGLAFRIARPTMVFGPGSPVQRGLEGLARLPVLPLVGGARAPLQPIWVDDLCDLLQAMLGEGRFAGDTLELGGPRIVPAVELLALMRRRAGRGAGPAVRVPARLLVTLLAAAERLAGPRLPVTAGQLASFLCDGSAKPHPLWEARRAAMTDLPEMLERGGG